MTEQETVRIKSINATRSTVVVPPQHARVVFDEVPGLTRKAGLIECSACCELIWHDPHKRLWVCANCGVDMTPQEAVLLINETEDMLFELRSYAYEKAGKKWRLEKFLRQLLRKVR